MKTILIVDDDPSFHFLCEMVFKQSGSAYKLLKAFDGVQALKILSAEHAVDLILLDINMPRMNGHEFLREYAKTGIKEIPVVAMLTSSDQRDDRESAMGYTFVKDYILKPLRDTHLERLSLVYQEICSRSKPAPVGADDRSLA